MNRARALIVLYTDCFGHSWFDATKQTRVTAAVSLEGCSHELSKAYTSPPNDIMVSHAKLGACVVGLILCRTIVGGGKMIKHAKPSQPQPCPRCSIIAPSSTGSFRRLLFRHSRLRGTTEKLSKFPRMTRAMMAPVPLRASRQQPHIRLAIGW